MKRILLLIILMAGQFARAQTVNGQSQIEFKNNASSTGWIGFDFYNGNQIFVMAKINGHDAAVQLVNSLGTAIIDKDFAALVGVQPPAGASTTVAIADIQFGNLTLKDIHAKVSQSKSSGHPRSFILSDDLFDKLAVDIDFANHRIAFINPADFTAPAAAVKLPFIKGSDSRSVPVSVDGADAVQFELYLGDPAPLTVYQAYYQAHGLLENRRTSVRLGGGKSHPHEAIATIDRVRFAGVDFTGVPGVFPTDSVRGSSSTLVSGNIGLDMLSRFRVIMDCSHNELYAIPAEGAANRPFLKDRSGLFLIEKEGDFKVAFVSPGSPAQKAGFKEGERIMQIDKMPVTSLQGQAWQKAALGSLRETTAGAVYKFTMEDGSVREFSAADFF